MKHHRLDPEITDAHGALALKVKLAQFDGEDADAKLHAALDWVNFVDCEVIIDLGSARITQIDVYELPQHVSFIRDHRR